MGGICALILVAGIVALTIFTKSPKSEISCPNGYEPQNQECVKLQSYVVVTKEGGMQYFLYKNDLIMRQEIFLSNNQTYYNNFTFLLTPDKSIKYAPNGDCAILELMNGKQLTQAAKGLQADCDIPERYLNTSISLMALPNLTVLLYNTIPQAFSGFPVNASSIKCVSYQTWFICRANSETVFQW